MDEPGELTPTTLPVGAVLVGLTVWLLARLTARREARRYERSVPITLDGRTIARAVRRP